MRRRGVAGALLLAALWAFTPGAGAVGGGAEELFREGVAAYEAGRFTEAASRFRQLLNEGYGEERVHYNLSCALFRQGDLGGSRLHAEIAAALDPTDTEARENIEFIKSQLADRPPAGGGGGVESALVRAADLLAALGGSGGIAWTLLLGDVAAVAFTLTAMRSRRLRGRAGIWGPMAGGALLVVVLSASVLGLIAWRRESVREGIILPDKVEVLAGPGATHPALFALHAGLKVRIQARREGWAQVRVPSGPAGWLRSDEVGEITLR